jgi:protein O-mannosyl-transferase
MGSAILRASPFRFGAVALVLLTVGAYLPALDSGFIWDDDRYVTNNQTLRSFSGLQSVWCNFSAEPQYYPLVFTTFWLEYQLWHLNPYGYHLDNILLHALAAILFWRLLVQLQLRGAWLAAAIFALHPVHVESVAWIAERKNVLSLALAIGSLLCYLQYMPVKVQHSKENDPQQRYYFFALVLFAAALLSKTVVVAVPATLALIYWWKRGRLTWSDIELLVPFFVLAIMAGVLTAGIEIRHVGAQGREWSYALPDRCLIAARSFWFYVDKLIWPHPLIFFYPRWETNVGSYWQYSIALSPLALVAVLWLVRKHIGRGPLAAVLVFGGVLFPLLGFFNFYYMRYSFVADHFQYHANLALIALVACGCGELQNRLKRPSRIAITGFIITGLAILAILTWSRSHVYHETITLYEATLNENPDCWLARNNLGVELQKIGRTEEAIEQYHETLILKPDSIEASVNLARAYASVERFKEAHDAAIGALQLAESQGKTTVARQIALLLLDRPAAEWRTMQALQSFP